MRKGSVTNPALLMISTRTKLVGDSMIQIVVMNHRTGTIYSLNWQFEKNQIATKKDTSTEITKCVTSDEKTESDTSSDAEDD